MNNSWARPGVRCVCIFGALKRYDTGEKNTYVVEGTIYKITSVDADSEGVYLALWGTPLDVVFTIRAFRPLVEINDDATADTALFLDIAAHASDLESERA